MRANVLINASLAAASTLLIQMTRISWLWFSLYLLVMIDEVKMKSRKNRLARLNLLYCLAATCRLSQSSQCVVQFIRSASILFSLMILATVLKSIHALAVGVAQQLKLLLLQGE